MHCMQKKYKYTKSCGQNSFLCMQPDLSSTIVIFQNESKIRSWLVYKKCHYLKIIHIDFTIAFTGNLGSGKSAAGNFFMQENVFLSKCSFKSVTKVSASSVGNFGEKRVRIVDTPGLYIGSSWNIRY